MKKQKTFEQIIEDIRAIRAERESADARMMIYLVGVEDGPGMKVLEDNGCATIDEFLKTHSICEPARYRNFRAGLRRLGCSATRAVEMGADAVVAAAKLGEGEQKSEKFHAWVDDWKAAKGGVRPTLETAQSAVRKIDPREEVPQVSLRAQAMRSELARLHEENAKLRAENAKLRAENAKLRKRAA